MKHRCAWDLRVKLKPHSELPYAEGEEFLQVTSRCIEWQASGLWKEEEAQAAVVQLCPKTSRRVRLRKSLWHDRPQQRRTGKSTQPAGMRCSVLGVASVASDVAECISIVQGEEKPRFRRLPLATVT